MMASPVRILLALTMGISASAVTAKDASQYNMSLQDEVVTGPKGSLTSPQAAAANKRAQIEETNVRKGADGIYRIGGWGIGNIIAVEAPEGWIIVDAGDYLEVAVLSKCPWTSNRPTIGAQVQNLATSASINSSARFQS